MTTRLFHSDGALPDPSDRRMIFVFGSNLAGAHAGGAARAAAEHFGAKQGISEGRTGDSYAVPTVDKVGEKLSLEKIGGAVYTFIKYATEHKEQRFFVTRIGCGLAGYNDEDIAPLFNAAPTNCDMPINWKAWIE